MEQLSGDNGMLQQGAPIMMAEMRHTSKHAPRSGVPVMVVDMEEPGWRDE